MSTLSERMMEALDESGRQQKDLASACGVKPPSANNWLSGKTKTMKASTAHRAAAFLGVNMVWLTEGRGPKRPQAATALSPSPNIHDQAGGAESAHDDDSNAPNYSKAIADLVSAVKPLPDGDVRLLTKIARRMGGGALPPPVESSAFHPEVPTRKPAKA